jgi:hypothetical protein
MGTWRPEVGGGYGRVGVWAYRRTGERANGRIGDAAPEGSRFVSWQVYRLLAGGSRERLPGNAAL